MANILENSMDYLAQFDPEIASQMQSEYQRQQRNIELIASENIASPAVIAAMGSVLTNKYAEGYPGKRYYGGCEVVDVIEQIAIDRAKQLFGAEYANVQPHSGAQANLAAYMAVLQPGDTIVGMDLANGGHLTHGAKVNLSGKIYNSFSYGVNPETGRIDFNEVEDVIRAHQPKLVVAGGEHMSPVPYADIVTTTTHKTLRGPRGGMILAREEFAKKINSAVFPGMQGGPLMHVIAAKAICLKEAMAPEFKIYAQNVRKNAAALAEALVANGFDLVSGGTDNHLMLVDLRSRGITGKELQDKLDEVHITINKNAIPNDPQKPSLTSGVRIGTPAATTRGFTPEDMPIIAECIRLIADDFDANRLKVEEAVVRLTAKHPMY